MAEQFRDIFGVGDGVTLSLFDVMGVMLGAMKELIGATILIWIASTHTSDVWQHIGMSGG